MRLALAVVGLSSAHAARIEIATTAAAKASGFNSLRINSEFISQLEFRVARAPGAPELGLQPVRLSLAPLRRHRYPYNFRQKITLSLAGLGRKWTLISTRSERAGDKVRQERARRRRTPAPCLPRDCPRLGAGQIRRCRAATRARTGTYSAGVTTPTRQVGTGCKSHSVTG